jgi:hypothetical protein
MNRRAGHPAWCSADHTCTAGRPGGEHRAEPHTLRVPGAGSAVLTRVQTDATGRQHAEVILSISLPDHEPDARLRLTALLAQLRLLISAPTPTIWADTGEIPTGAQRHAQLPPARRRAA